MLPDKAYHDALKHHDYPDAVKMTSLGRGVKIATLEDGKEVLLFTYNSAPYSMEEKVWVEGYFSG